GTEDGVDVGPLIDEAGRDKVQRLLDDAVQHGATVITGGQPVDGDGYFFTPTVITGVSPDAALNSEEIFGPVAPLTSFTDEDDVVRLANGSRSGLVGYVFTNNLRRAIRVAEALDFGMVGLNSGLVSNPYAPFGGVKESGL